MFSQRKTTAGSATLQPLENRLNLLQHQRFDIWTRQNQLPWLPRPTLLGKCSEKSRICIKKKYICTCHIFFIVKELLDLQVTFLQLQRKQWPFKWPLLIIKRSFNMTHLWWHSIEGLHNVGCQTLLDKMLKCPIYILWLCFDIVIFCDCLHHNALLQIGLLYN